MKTLTRFLCVFLALLAFSAVGCDKKSGGDGEEKEEKDPRELVEKSIDNHNKVPPFKVSVPYGIMGDRNRADMPSIEWDNDELSVRVSAWGADNAADARTGFCDPKYSTLKDTGKKGDKSYAVCQGQGWIKYTVGVSSEGRTVTCSASVKNKKEPLDYLQSICDSFDLL